MKSRSLALALFVAVPSVALAAEPAKGTIIMVSSVGLWVLGSSLLMLRKGNRPEADTKKPADKADPSPHA